MFSSSPFWTSAFAPSILHFCSSLLHRFSHSLSFGLVQLSVLVGIKPLQHLLSHFSKSLILLWVSYSTRLWTNFWASMWPCKWSNNFDLSLVRSSDSNFLVTTPWTLFLRRLIASKKQHACYSY